MMLFNNTPMKNTYSKPLIATLLAASCYLPCVQAAEHGATHTASATHDHRAMQDHSTDTEHITGTGHAPDTMHDHGDNPVIAKLIVDKLELQNTSGDQQLALEAQAWIGTDLHKFWLKTDLEKRAGTTEHAELQALYSRAISAFWDVQMGVRQSLQPAPTQEWGVVGIHGLAPYWFEVDAALLVGDGGKTALRLGAEYEWRFSQKVILSPSLEANFYGQNDLATGTASGLAQLSAGLRLRYEIKREFAPYIGLSYHKTRDSYQTQSSAAAIAPNHGEANTDTRLVAGVRIWF